MKGWFMIRVHVLQKHLKLVSGRTPRMHHSYSPSEVHVSTQVAQTKPILLHSRKTPEQLGEVSLSHTRASSVVLRSQASGCRFEEIHTASCPGHATPWPWILIWQKIAQRIRHQNIPVCKYLNIGNRRRYMTRK